MEILYEGENEIRVRYFFQGVPQGKGVHAFTMRLEPGSYDVYIDPSLCPVSQKLALEHELEHIRNGDFERKEDVNKVEYRTHKKEGDYHQNAEWLRWDQKVIGK